MRIDYHADRAFQSYRCPLTGVRSCIKTGANADILILTQWANFGLMRRSKQRPIDHLVGDRRTQFTQATPLSEDPQSTASRLIARPGRSTPIL
jgi:hypothetical protein